MPATLCRFLLAASLLAVAGCGGDDDHNDPEPPAVPMAMIEGPVTGGGGILLQSTSFDLGDVGYMETEYFMSGTARSFRNVGALDSDGMWTTEVNETADYKTRIVARRPIDEADFNGIVLVEWFNVSAGFDSGPDWIFTHVELIRRGYAYLGVSAQFVGVEGGGQPIAGLDFALKTGDPERYGSLSHPGDSFSFDIFSQAARALYEREGVDPLQGLAPEYVIAAGESQSAFRLTTYINGMAEAAGLFDGYLVHSRGGGSAALSQAPQELIETPNPVFIRTDLGVPILTFQADTDVFELGYWSDRQDDDANFRLWEVAGTAHADMYTLLLGAGDLGDDPSVADIIVTADPIPGIISCDNPINSGPHHFVLKAAVRALEEWVRNGTAPPTAPRIALSDDTPPTRVFDELGIGVGGIRTPYVDAPIARLLGESPGGSTFCFLFGKTIPLEQEILDELYPEPDSYAEAVAASTQEAVEAGFLLPEDAQLILESGPALRQ